MRVPLLIAGAGVRVGAAPKDAKLVDVAPTIATLLGVRPPL
jgi:arylsulfatase A-like enzyme